LFEICDRIYVIASGALSHSLIRSETNVEEVGLLMTGTGAGNEAHQEDMQHAL
jgi:ABC-type sugar transport system ATPase subunit